MPKYVAGHSGRTELVDGKAELRKGETIRLGNSHYNEGEEIPERAIKNLAPATLENDLKRGIIKRIEDAAPAKTDGKPPEGTGGAKPEGTGQGGKPPPAK